MTPSLGRNAATRSVLLFTVLAAVFVTTTALAAPASASDASPVRFVYPSYEAAAAAGPWLAPDIPRTVEPGEPVEPARPSEPPDSDPVFDPLRPIRPLLTSSIDTGYLASVGAIAVDSDILRSIGLDDASIALTHHLDNNSSISSYCTYARSGAGAGSAGGSVEFTVAAEATAYGRYKGVEIVATGVDCTLHKPDMAIGTGLVWAPGSLSVATAQRSSYDARGGHVCVEAWALLRQPPAGESSALKTTGETCFLV